MIIVHEDAPAKINLALDVLGKRTDGYHDLKMVMASVSLYDSLTITLTPVGRGDETFIANSTDPRLPQNDENIAARAARLFMRRVGITGWSCHIYIEKNIPVCAGLGGGSSDAAAVLRALGAWHPISEEILAALALELGSDVPYCLHGGLCLAEGRGEILTPLPPLQDCHIVLSTPPTSVSTAVAFGRLDIDNLSGRPLWTELIGMLRKQDLIGTARHLANVFETAGAPCEIACIEEAMLESGAQGAVMSGTGPSVLGVFDDAMLAGKAFEILRVQFPNTFIVNPV